MANTQIRHIRATLIAPGSNAWTACGRTVVTQMTRVDPHKSNCPECHKNTHKNNAFEIVRG